AGAAVLAGRPVGDRLAAPEAAMGEQVVELARPLAHQMRKHLALLLAGQVRARRGRGQIELRGVAGMLGHDSLTPATHRSTGTRIARLPPLVKSPDSHQVRYQKLTRPRPEPRPRTLRHC